GGSSADPFFASLFDRLARARLTDSASVFVGWSGCSLRTLRRAKALGMVTILERGAVHIVEQKRLLDEELVRQGLRGVTVPQALIDRELVEYEECDAICVPSQTVLRSFLERGFRPQKLFSVPYGVDTQLFRPLPSDRGSRPFRFIFCGAL